MTDKCEKCGSAWFVAKGDWEEITDSSIPPRQRSPIAGLAARIFILKQKRVCVRCGAVGPSEQRTITEYGT